MSILGPRHSKEAFASRGDAIFDRNVGPRAGPEDEGKFVLIDIEMGVHEIDRDELTAPDRILARRFDAQMWRSHVGAWCACRIAPLCRANGA